MVERPGVTLLFVTLDKSGGEADHGVVAVAAAVPAMVRDRSVRRAVVLLGPRRVGKTVLIHHAIGALLQEGVPARRIGYLSVDLSLYTDQSLERLLALSEQAAGGALGWIFFDEIQ